MKKKLTAVALVVCMLAIMLVGASLAYFTDTAEAENTFTVGSVKIKMTETDASGAEFKQNQVLMPGKENAIEKVVTITNTGKSNAWIWAEVLIPADLDDNDDNSPAAPGLGNSLHVNYPGMYAKEYAQNQDANAKFYNTDLTKLWVMQHNADGLSYGYAGTETVDGVVYNKFVKFYTDELKPDETTPAFMSQVYMDAKVTQGENNAYILADGKTPYTGSWEVLVRGYAMQAAGFDSAVEAYVEYNKPAQ